MDLLKAGFLMVPVLSFILGEKRGGEDGFWAHNISDWCYRIVGKAGCSQRVYLGLYLARRTDNHRVVFYTG